MGRVLSPYGVRGWLKVREYTEAAGGLLDYRQWWLAGDRAPSAWVRYDVEEARVHAGNVVAKLAALDDREGALRQRGALVAVPLEALPALGEEAVYWHDLVGMRVVNRAGELLGEVAAVRATGAHPILEVAGADGRLRLVPMVDVFLDAIDRAGRTIAVDWGLDY